MSYKTRQDETRDNWSGFASNVNQPPQIFSSIQPHIFSFLSVRFKPRENGEVGFAVGDLIEVIEQDDSGWWIGISNGVRGQFPGNYVQLQ
jgi:hypothetical protein